MTCGPEWSEESIARLRNKWLTPPDDEPLPLNPFDPPVESDDYLDE